jgi:hypothetical protein
VAQVVHNKCFHLSLRACDNVTDRSKSLFLLD